jgi:hypothetical protein
MNNVFIITNFIYTIISLVTKNIATYTLIIPFYFWDINEKGTFLKYLKKGSSKPHNK